MAHQQRAHLAGCKRPRGNDDGVDCAVCRSCAWDAVADAVAEWEPTRRDEPNNHPSNDGTTAATCTDDAARLAALSDALQRCTAAFAEVADRMRREEEEEEENKVPLIGFADEARERSPSNFLLLAVSYCSKEDMRLRGPDWGTCMFLSDTGDEHSHHFTALYTPSNVFLTILDEMLFWRTLTAHRPPVASDPLCRCGGALGRSISPEAALAALEGLLAAEVSAAAEALGSECDAKAAELSARRRHAVYTTMEMCLSLSLSPSLYMHWEMRPFNAVADALSTFLRQGTTLPKRYPINEHQLAHSSQSSGADEEQDTPHCLMEFGWNPLDKLSFAFARLPLDDSLVLSPLSGRFDLVWTSAASADDRRRQRAEAAARSEHDANDGVRNLSEDFGVGKSYATPYAGVAAAAAAAVGAQPSSGTVGFDNSNEEADDSDGEEDIAAENIAGTDVNSLPFWSRIVEGRPRGSYGADARRVVAAMRALCPHLLVPYLLGSTSDLPEQQEFIFYLLCAIGDCEEALTGFPSSADVAWPKPPLGLLSNGRRSCRQRCACGCGGYYNNDLKPVTDRGCMVHFMKELAHQIDPRGASLILDAYLCAEPYLPPLPLAGGEHPLRLALSKMRTHSRVVWRFIRSLVTREALAAAPSQQFTTFLHNSTPISDEAMEAARRRLIAAASEPAPWMKGVSGASLVPPLEPAGSDPPTLLWLYVAQFSLLCRSSIRGYNSDSDWFATGHGPAAASHVSHALRVISFLAAPGGCDPNAVTGVDGAFTSPASTALGTACKWVLPPAVIARLLAVGADPNRLFCLGRRYNQFTYAYPLETYIREAGLCRRKFVNHTASATIAATRAPVALRRQPFWFGTPFTPPPSALGVSVPPFAPGYVPSPQDEFVREYVEVVEVFIAAGAWPEASSGSLFSLGLDRGYSSSSDTSEENSEWSSDSDGEGADEDESRGASPSSFGSFSPKSLPYAADQPSPSRGAKAHFLCLLLKAAPIRALLHLFSVERRRLLFDHFVELGGCNMCAKMSSATTHPFEVNARRHRQSFFELNAEEAEEKLAALMTAFRSAESEAYASITSDRLRRGGSALACCGRPSQSLFAPPELPQSLLAFTVRKGWPAATSVLLRMGVGHPYSGPRPHAAIANSLAAYGLSVLGFTTVRDASAYIKRGLDCLKAVVHEGGFSPAMFYWCLRGIERQRLRRERTSLSNRTLSAIEKMALELTGAMPPFAVSDTPAHPFDYDGIDDIVRNFWTAVFDFLAAEGSINGPSCSKVRRWI